MVAVWSVRARTLDLRLTDPVRFTQLSVVERYNQPDTAVLQGTTHDLAPVLVPGMGAVFYDGPTYRTSGVVTGVERHGDGTAQVTLTGDLVRLYDRVCYPDPGNAFIAQTKDHDVRTGAVETVLLGFINANAGPGAIVDRQVSRLRLPGSLGRGPAATVSARLDELGPLVARLAERANLRVRVVHTSPTLGNQGWVDVVVDAAPDLSVWARYGTPASGGPGLLSPDWEYGVGAPTATRIEVAAGGTGVARIFEEQGSPSSETAWGRRIERVVDQRQTTDVDEINQAGFDALVEGMGPTSVSVNIVDSAGARVGVDVPVGAVVAATLDGLVVKERVREVTTTVQVQSGAPTVTVEPLFGSIDTTKQTQWQRQLTKILRRISVIERAN
jgi:hypothetical protein